MKIIVTEDSAYVAENGENIADIAFIGGLAPMIFGGGEGIAAKQEELASRRDAELREQAVTALALDYTPPQFIAERDELRRAVRENRKDAASLSEAYYAKKFAWARQVAPTLEVIKE